MIKHFNKVPRENSRLRLGEEYFSFVNVIPLPKKVNKRLLPSETIDLMLLNSERKLIKFNQKDVKKDHQSTIAMPNSAPQNRSRNQILEEIELNHSGNTLLGPQSLVAFPKQNLSSSDRLKSAIKRYRYQAQLHPDSPIVQTNLGKLYHKNQQWQEAICCYKKAIAIDGNYAPARKYLAQIVNK